MNDLSKLIKKYPEHLVIEKCLWYRDIGIEIKHIDNDLSKPLDYLAAFLKLDEKITSQSSADE